MTIALFVMAGYDVLFSRRAGGDPTVPVDTSPSTATTYNNPGFRERRPKNGMNKIDVYINRHFSSQEEFRYSNRMFTFQGYQ